MPASACILFKDGHCVELTNGERTAGKGKGEAVLLGALRKANDAPVTAAVKRVSPEEDVTFDDYEVRGLQIEEGKMRQMDGQPPFLPVLTADAHPHSPASHHKSDGTKKKLLCIAMPFLDPDSFIEVNKLFGWDGEADADSFNLLKAAERFRSSGSFEEGVERLRGDLRVITKALLLVTQAHQGALSRGGFSWMGSTGTSCCPGTCSSAMGRSTPSRQTTA
ncbi:unnamed protein product [Vitrella brassicaformis CCMP3155]|uniref:Uncharacterized protein n=1 Tax=Vitrella brassicaformis (strain CCMP3155) TaxID=1169540 RepID=A0A0G4FGP8_VITBC|nr:unnamed protein product [Vitrella brassicaformis CCMP3155]|eukprot:CEM12617.1 unnamed protein product [Vitrella brassicaformis CCMP3155]